MVIQSIYYLLKRLLKITLSATFVFLGFIYLVYLIMLPIGGMSGGEFQLDISSWWNFMLVGFGLTEVVKYFRFSNLLGMTRRQHAVIYLLFGAIAALIFLVISFIIGQFATEIIIGPFKLMQVRYGVSFARLFSVFSRNFLVLISASLVALIFDKFPRNVGIFVALGGLFLGLPLMTGAAAVLYHYLLQYNVVTILKIINIIRSVPMSVWKTLLYVVVISGYWLVQRRHVSRSLG
ncbi:hypothetical protein I4Q36_01115 [Tuanshanicoccus lijuaniae]|uniref:hypothetical protein n=1 Tax=Aerococcaceae bacterium zg-1292 TaxID=2774330 RepID=UPI001936EF07|nr:hypothetical protein [Aerococcaceae bacterium zg-1292]QQA37348.1 hypothetical protein I4Q36_01115 [Aerococcaceae bacterium zg-1292]